MLDLLSALSPLQVSLVALGGLTVVGVVAYNYWTSRKSSPRLPEPLSEPTHTLEPLLDLSGATEPVLDEDFANLPQPERKPLLDALIDVISTIEVDQPVSPFVLRLRGGGNGSLPSCALFEADGGKWRLAAIENVKAWLASRLPASVPVYG